MVYTRLAELSPTAIGAAVDDDDEPDSIPYLRFDPAAQPEFDAWRGRLEVRLRANELPSGVESHLAKYRSLIPSLALLFHLANGQSGAVCLNALQQAIAWGDYLESHAYRIYSAAVNPAKVAGSILARRILGGSVEDGFALRDAVNTYVNNARNQGPECIADPDDQMTIWPDE